MGKTVIMKFGGASLASPERFDAIASLILKRKQECSQIVIVVSAMGKTTDDLVALAKTVHPSPPQREYDMLLSAGERISMALLAMAIAKKNQEAISFTGSQSGIITTSHHTEAKIIDVRPRRLIQSLAANKIVIVAGFQGVSQDGEITTLGRGGSDTTAVALGVALDADRVEFYKDVGGIFTEDPKKNPHAHHFPTISYDEAIRITGQGAKILHQRSLILAKVNRIPLHIRSFDEKAVLSSTLIEEHPRSIMQKIYEHEVPHASQS